MQYFSSRSFPVKMIKRFKFSLWTTTCLLVIYQFFILMNPINGFGFDSATSCSPKASRRGRAQLLASIPCDLTQQPYCNLPGSSYPWHAVRRFVHDNQGLMKRMYGDIRHISILRTEIQNNEIDVEDIEATAVRYSKESNKLTRNKSNKNPTEESNRKMKYLHSDSSISTSNIEYSKRQVNRKVNDISNEPHFHSVQRNQQSSVPPSSTPRGTEDDNSYGITEEIYNQLMPEKMKSNKIPSRSPTTTTMRITTLKRSGTITTKSNIVENIEKNQNSEEKHKNKTTTGNYPESLENLLNAQIKVNIESQSILRNNGNNLNETSEDYNLESNDILDIKTPNRKDENSLSGNIKVVQAPDLNPNKTVESVTITTTLKVVQQIIQSEMEFERKNEKQEAATADLMQTSTEHQSQQGDEQNLLPEERTNSNEAITISPFPEDTNINKNDGTQKPASKDHNYAQDNLELGNSNANYNINNNEKRESQQEATPSKSNVDKKTNVSSTVEKKKPPTKQPVMNTMEGQLFQDTVQKDVPVANVRGINACPVKEEVVAPFWANNTRGEVLALLNLYPFEQYVHWEKCTHEHKQMYCRDGCRCEQQYRLHRLLAYDPHNECRGIFSDWFRFPSCCICKCYDIPFEFRVTSRSPRTAFDDTSENSFLQEDDDNPDEIDEFDDIDDDMDGNANEDVESSIDEFRKKEIHRARDGIQKAIYEHATKDWYRPRDNIEELNLYFEENDKNST